MSRIFIAGTSIRPLQHVLICILLARSPPLACSDTRHSASSPDVLETTGSRPTWWSWWRESSPLFRYHHQTQPSILAFIVSCAQYKPITIVRGDNRIMSRSLNICEHEVIGLNIFSVSPSRLTIYRAFTDRTFYTFTHYRSFFSCFSYRILREEGSRVRIRYQSLMNIKLFLVN